MNSKIIVICALILLARVYGYCQQSISLDVLYDGLKKNHPLQELTSLQSSIQAQQLKLNNESRLPQINLTGQATWQSDVTKVSIPFPGIEIPSQPNDQYRALLDINLPFYDGGTRKSLAVQINQQSEVENANTEVMLYSMKESVCKAYFGAKMAGLSSQQLDLLITDLEQKEKLLSEQINGGIASGYQAAVLKVKIVEARQSKDEALRQKSIAVQVLNTLTGMNVHVSDTFIENSSYIRKEVRPEHQLFDAQKKLQLANLEASKTRFAPKVQTFAQLGYGRPGLNLLSNQFKPYSILGLRAQWNLTNLYSNHTTKEKNIVLNSLSKITVQQDAFDLQQKVKADQLQSDVENYIALLEQDDQIIILFEKVLTSSNVRFEQGISTINDYTTDANNLSQAKIKRSIHQILLQQSMELLNLIQLK